MAKGARQNHTQLAFTLGENGLSNGPPGISIGNITFVVSGRYWMSLVIPAFSVVKEGNLGENMRENMSTPPNHFVSLPLSRQERRKMCP